MIRVLLADDQVLVRAGFRALLNARDDIEVVGEAADGAEAVSLARMLVPDVVLMDIRMPGTDGLAAATMIASEAPLASVRIVISPPSTSTSMSSRPSGAGPAASWSKTPSRRAGPSRARRRRRRRPSLTRCHPCPGLRVRGPRQQRAPASSLDILTEREREVMALVAGGLSNDEIAGRLFMSPATAKTHVSRAMIKLGARDRAQLVVLAYESGLVRPGWRT